MTKQELEKAIENKDTIWYIDFLYDTPKDMLLNGIYEVNSCICEDVGRVYYLKDVERNSYYRMDYIFKTQAQAKHYSYRSNITRTETLPFLTWEEFLKETRLNFIACDGVSNMILYCCNNTIYLVDEEYPEFNTTSWDLTEANFYKAYDECVRLFKGE